MPLTLEVLQSGCWAQALALWLLWRCSLSSFWLVLFLVLGKELHVPVFCTGGTPLFPWGVPLQIGDVLSLFGSAVLAFCHTHSTCLYLPGLQPHLSSSGKPSGPVWVCLPALAPASPACSVTDSQGPPSLCCLPFSVLKIPVLNVLSGCLVVLGGNLNLVPVIPSWLGAESLVCIFLSPRTFPILGGLENSAAQTVLTLPGLTICGESLACPEGWPGAERGRGTTPVLVAGPP